MLQKETSSKQDAVERGGHRLLLVGICALLAGLAVPLVLVFLIKSPLPEKHILIFGISYYKLIFILFLSSAIIVHASLFFIRAKPVIILFLFCLLLFCCFPFIIGLKKNLTLNQAIFNIPFLANWPFYLNPGYMLIEFLIPLGVLFYLYLQIKKIFSKRQHNYAFLCAAIYLSIAAFLGLSGLAQARQPTIGSAIMRLLKIDPVHGDMGTLLQRTSQDSLYPKKVNPIQPGVIRFPIPSMPSGANERKADLQTKPQGIENFSKKLHRLSERIDGLKLQLDTMEESLLKKQEGTWHSEDKETIVELQQEMQRLSDKIEYISNTFGQMAHLLTGGGEKLNKNEMRSEDKQIAPQKKEDMSSD